MIKNLVPALAEGGKIKIGGLGAEKKSSGGGTYRMPVKLDHFLVTTTERDRGGDLVLDNEMMNELPKDQDGHCREIPIVLHDDDIERVFPTTYALYKGKKLACRGDGEVAERFEFKDDKRTGASKQMECPCPFLGATSGPICKPHGTLHCSIRIRGRAVAGSVYRWRTTSMISIQRMIGSLQQIRDICGTLCGIPLVLKVQPIQVAPPNAPASTVYCCHVELRATDILAIQRQAIEAGAMRARVRQAAGYQALLAAPGIDESEDEESEVQQEFHPEGEAAGASGGPTSGPIRIEDVLGNLGAKKDATPIPAQVIDVSPEPDNAEAVGDAIQAINTLVQQFDEKSGRPGCGFAVLKRLAKQDHLNGLSLDQLTDLWSAMMVELKDVQSPKAPAATPQGRNGADGGGEGKVGKDATGQRELI